MCASSPKYEYLCLLYDHTRATPNPNADEELSPERQLHKLATAVDLPYQLKFYSWFVGTVLINLITLMALEKYESYPAVMGV